MSFAMPDLLPAWPEIFVLVMACVVLIVDLFLSDARRHISYALTLATLVGSALITLGTHQAQTVYTFSGMFVDDVMSDTLKLMVYGAVFVLLVYSRIYAATRGFFRGEFFVLALFATLGMMVMISANHLLTLYLGLELLSLSLYSMVALQRDSAAATEAAMKYFVLGALASGMLLYGMSMLYGTTGTLELTKIAEGVANVQQGPMRIVLVFALVFLVAGIGFKLGAVPFHMWLPDVYQGAPTAVTLFVGAAPKLSGFAFAIRLLSDGLQDLLIDWQQMLIILAVLSMAIGNITAIAQTNLKRMLAYSTISHMGFMLLGVLAGDRVGYSSAMFYVIVYVLMTLGMFGMIMLLAREGFEAERLEDFKGLNARSPWYAFITLLLMFSLAGSPPTVGFYAKLTVLQAVINIDQIWLAVVAVVFSLIGAFYYLRIVKLMYFDAPQDTSPIVTQPDVRLLMSINGLAMLALGIRPEWLMALCAASFP